MAAIWLILKFKRAALIIHEFLEPHWKSLSYILLQGLNKDCFHTVIFVLWLGWWMEDKKIDSITAFLTECRGKSRICLYGRQGAGWRTKRLGIVFVFLWCWILWGRWDGSVWRGWRETGRRERLFSLNKKIQIQRNHLCLHSMYVCMHLAYQWSVSDRHSADDQCVSSQRVLGQLGVCWVVQVCGLGCKTWTYNTATH